MDKQEALEKNWEWFVVQGNPRSIAVTEWSDGEEICRYRTPSGCKCAIGVLIPDDRYSEKMEGESADRYWIDRCGMEDILPVDDAMLALLKSLQGAHDAYMGHYHGDFTDYMRKELTELAEEHNLTIPSTR